MKTLTATQNILDFKMAWAFKVADDITATCKKYYLEDIKIMGVIFAPASTNYFNTFANVLYPYRPFDFSK